MIEKQLEQSMHAALVGEPPLGFDPDEVVDRAARRQRQRRSAIATMGAAATVLAVAVTTVLVTSDRTPQTGAPPTTRQGVCQYVPAGHLQPSGFRGSAGVVDRMERTAPGIITEHLGAAAAPADQMSAYDCPPTIGAGYSIAGSNETFGLVLMHGRAGLDLANDSYADDPEYDLRDERHAADGSLIRIYLAASPLQGPLIVSRFGTDGMIIEASVSAPGAVDEQDLVDLVSDPRLAFPLPR